MKPLFGVLFLVCLFSFFTQKGIGQVCEKVLSSELSNDNLHTVIKWEGLQAYKMYRKEFINQQWSLVAQNLNEGTFTDLDSEPGKAYHYALVSNDDQFLNEIVFNYPNIYAGFDIPNIDYKGRVMLMVEESVYGALKDKLSQWKKDAEGDGWSVIERVVPKNLPVPQVKEIIKEAYYHKDGLGSLFLVGHIPVPYSGSFAHDGHGDHRGAWPCDFYYADMDEVWTDYKVNIPNVPARTSNIPGDGKYDNDNIETAEIEVGRVDFINMPAFKKNEIELLRAYFDKAHLFKTKGFTPRNKAFGKSTFSGNPTGCPTFRNYGPILGSENIITGSFRDSLKSNSYLFAYGAGGGSYVSAQGITNSTEVASDSLQAVFTILWGSYFGDWDVTNNLMRAVLGSGTVLATSWSSQQTLYHFGLGSTIGRVNANNQTIPNSANNFISLLGDPTLRMQYVKPITDIEATFDQDKVLVDWTDTSGDPDISQYYIYRKSSKDSIFQMIASIPAGQFRFTDKKIPTSGNLSYMVRAEKKEKNKSGSYFNKSIGVATSVVVPFVDHDGDGVDGFADCDDTNANISPLSQEINGNALDDNCNGIIDEVDVDNDGYFDYQDCNDMDNKISPDAVEIFYNGVDEDCDGNDGPNESCYNIDKIKAKGDFKLILPCDSLPFLLLDKQVKPNDAYFFSGEDQRTYEFNFCDAYNSDLWDALILLYEYNSKNGGFGSLLKQVEGCSVQFKFDLTKDFPEYAIVIRDKHNCSRLSDVGNGVMTLNCIYFDGDGDGFFDYQDCDDTNASVNPNQSEIPFNLIDDDCDKNTLDSDGDFDGYSITEDCNDNNPNINPSALEIYDNGIDDNCNGVIDELDADNDGFGIDEDCDDTNASVNPEAYDYANNNLDEDCDGIYFSTDTCLVYKIGPFDDFEGQGDICLDGPLTSKYSAQANYAYEVYGLQPDVTYFYDACTGFDYKFKPIITIQQYNHITKQKGQIINGQDSCYIEFTFPYHKSFPDILIIVNIADDCGGLTAPALGKPILGCLKIDEDGDGFFNYEDCDDANAEINPNAVELANNIIDENCDGLVLIIDVDGDSFNSDLDCNDNDSSINPSAVEIPNNGIDEDCDGEDFVSKSVDINLSNFVLHPNPAKSLVYVTAFNAVKFKLSVLTIDGVLVLIQDSPLFLNVSNFKSGMYIIKVEDSISGHHSYKKLIIAD
jgi:hypothetical protein